MQGPSWSPGAGPSPLGYLSAGHYGMLRGPMLRPPRRGDVLTTTGIRPADGGTGEETGPPQGVAMTPEGRSWEAWQGKGNGTTQGRMI